jgi:hypothetical protein
MLVFFAFSITPKKLLHDLVAHHKDTRALSVKQDSGLPHISKAGFHCQCEQLVAETPFLHGNTAFSLLITPLIIARYDQPVIAFYSAEDTSSRLRGPPFVCV